MDDGIIEINTNDTDGIIASLSTLSGELSSISSGDINCSCGEINALCGGDISAAINKIGTNLSEAFSCLTENNNKIKEIVDDMYILDIIDDENPFSFEDVISFMSQMEKSGIHRADANFFVSAGYEVVDGVVTISGEDTRHINQFGRHSRVSKVGKSAGAQHEVAGAVAYERAVGAVGGQCDATVVGSIHSCSVGIFQLHARESHQFSCICLQIVGVAQFVDIKLLEQGFSFLQVGMTNQLVVGAPQVTAHTADGFCSGLGVGVDAANL